MTEPTQQEILAAAAGVRTALAAHTSAVRRVNTLQSQLSEAQAVASATKANVDKATADLNKLVLAGEPTMTLE